MAHATNRLNWPLETANSSAQDDLRWQHAGSNICLDFHGDPLRAKLVVFSDGNHHMALEETLRTYLDSHPDIEEIFYATTPPSVVVQVLTKGALFLGNLRISVQPNVFIGPGDVLDRLVAKGYMSAHIPFMQSRGNVLLVRKGSP